MSMSIDIKPSKYGWKARFDHKPKTKCKPIGLPRVSQLLGFKASDTIPMALRFVKNVYIRKYLIEHKLPYIDPLKNVPWEPIYGVPIGGIGCGAMGRGFRGEFVRSSLLPGLYTYNAQPADQFIVTIRRDDRVVYNQVLSPSKQSTSPFNLSDWKWDFPTDKGNYTGLYPRSWTVYELQEFQLTLVCLQISPVMPGNYKESSYPTCAFIWQAVNHGEDKLTVSLTLTWHGPDPPSRLDKSTLKQFYANGGGLEKGFSGKEFKTSFCSRSSNWPSAMNEQTRDDASTVKGCTLERFIGDDLPCCFAVGARQSQQVNVKCWPALLLKGQSDQVQSTTPSYSSTTTTTDKTGSIPTHQLLSPNQFWAKLAEPEAYLASQDTKVSYSVGPDPSFTSKSVPKLGIAVTATCHVPPVSCPTSDASNQGNRKPGIGLIEFSLSWHSPFVKFRDGQVRYKRYYTRFIDQQGQQGAQQLARLTLQDWSEWNKSIEDWQAPVINDDSLPDWYKSALFNELYFLTDGGTIWLDPVEINGHEPLPTDIQLDAVRSHDGNIELDRLKLIGRNANPDRMKQACWQHRCQLGRDIGLFAYLEGHEYRMFNTIDVHYYASWALIKLWPRLQLAINYDCADLTVGSDASSKQWVYKSHRDVVSRPLAVPHDFGEPESDPWRSINAYSSYPTDEWKDLAPKFVLQAWRDWRLTRDDLLLGYMLPIAWCTIRTGLSVWDHDDDGLVENGGFPDQTFDMWTTKGLSAYTGGLWLASLYALHDMLHYALHDSQPLKSLITDSRDDRGSEWSDVLTQLSDLLEKAKKAYDTKLWNGSCYAYQEEEKDQRGNFGVMAAQLAGYWFVCLAGDAQHSLLPKSHVTATLETIVRTNWRAIDHGKLGAINSYRPDLQPDVSNMQAEEFWTGVNYALASILVAEDKPEQGLQLAESCYDTVYNKFSLQFQTPEAYMSDGRFRSLGYMRPLAIWSLQHALEVKGLAESSNHLDVVVVNGDNKLNGSS